jgi:hypothetical protein
MNFFKFVIALRPGTILYDKTTDQLLISCGCKSYIHRLGYGLSLKTALPRGATLIPTELTNVKNLRNFTIVGRLK